ncbi:hypothetical protein [Phycicoccus avicenniae]|uniref:hypothetical protein n=1 Tax=Phycicoccus avicenniae TaxID=2828860 RepID=UPI003D297B63
MTPLAALAIASALHAGFQVTVTTLVYPVLAAQPAGSFAAAHDAHSRRIVPLVGAVYLAVLLAGGWVLVAAPLGPAVVVALAAQALALGTTALVAAPTHGALGREGPAPALLRRLLVADRVRAGAALAGLAAAVVAAVAALP